MIPLIWEQTGDRFSGGLLWVRDDKFATGFVDRKGQTVIARKFQHANMFSEGLAGVSLAGKWGYVNKAGVMVIAPKFDQPTNSARDWQSFKPSKPGKHFGDTSIKPGHS